MIVMAYLQQNINAQGIGVFKKTPTLNMLNTKYIILNPNQRPVENAFRFGNAWFVSNVKKVKTSNEEILALSDSTVDLSRTAVISESFGSVNSANDRDETATIKMVKYAAIDTRVITLNINTKKTKSKR